MSPYDYPRGRAAYPPGPGSWERRPWWQFWRPAMCRRVWRLTADDTLWIQVWEYQHPAFVARDMLEKRFNPRHRYGETAQEGKAGATGRRG